MKTFVRLLGFLRPYRRGLVLSGLLAVAAMGMTVLIPWLTGRERAHMMSELQSRLDELATRGTPAAVRLRAAQGLLAAEPFAFWRWRLARPLLRPQRD